MKKGINRWSFPAEMSVEGCLKLSKKAGFEGLELNLAEEGEFSLKTSEEGLRKIRGTAEKYGIELRSLSLEIPYFLTEEEPKRVEKAKACITASLKIASKMGIDTVLLVPGGVDVSIWSAESRIVSYDMAYQRAKDNLCELASFAEETKVCIGVENVWNKFLLSPLEFKDFIDSLNSEYVQAYFDVGNVIVNGYPQQWIRILGKRIKKVHVKDFKSSIGNINGFCNLLEGDVNWPEVMAALKEIKYDDYLTAEMIPPYKYYPEQLLYDTSYALDVILKK